MSKLGQIVCKCSQNFRLLRTINRQIPIKISYRLCNVNSKKSKIPLNEGLFKTFNVAFALSILTWLGFTKEDEEKESELIMTLKRAVLCTQREQYEKAEQMLHLALR